MLLVAGCSSTTDEESADAREKYNDTEQELSEKLGAGIRILEPNGYSLLSASLLPNEEGEYREVGLGYGVMEDGKEAVEISDKQSEKLSKTEYVYGPYKGNANFRVAIQPIKDEFDIESFAIEAGGEVTEIEGQNVAYAEIDTMPRQLRAFVPFNDVLYSLVIPLEGEGTGLSKEDAFDYIKKIVNEYKNN
ncbi:hypothetical protein GH741_11240 [Aquibacillus halophilus]|uniref:Uncharacterized protein n=1 Tax=Aquibacillus halophilus TaxID=930132 RepID=A0A6A8DCI1_9BACI|nr:hypothetical protein [Aquibacillus halophilus]MRH43254.1 hypothetical protein [Aquibacillus halophilus]